MKKLFYGGYMLCLLSFTAFSSIEQEFICQPKEKKVSVSCQQYIELVADIVKITNEAIAHLVELQRSAITEINGYAHADKDCFINNATKKQRIQKYSQKMKVKDELLMMINKLLLID